LKEEAELLSVASVKPVQR